MYHPIYVPSDYRPSSAVLYLISFNLRICAELWALNSLLLQTPLSSAWEVQRSIAHIISSNLQTLNSILNFSYRPECLFKVPKWRRSWILQSHRDSPIKHQCFIRDDDLPVRCVIQYLVMFSTGWVPCSLTGTHCWLTLLPHCQWNISGINM